MAPTPAWNRPAGAPGRRPNSEPPTTAWLIDTDPIADNLNNSPDCASSTPRSARPRSEGLCGRSAYRGNPPLNRHSARRVESWLSSKDARAEGGDVGDYGDNIELDNGSCASGRLEQDVANMSTWAGQPSIKGSTETVRMFLLTCVSIGITCVYVFGRTADIGLLICGHVALLGVLR